MSQYKIAAVIGSIRQDSLNRKLARALARLAPENFTFEDVRIDDLPLYNQDLDGKQPEAVQRFKTQLSSAQGVLFVTPEFNRSMPGALKNAIDQGSRPYGQSSFGGKPAGVIGISPGAPGTAMAQQHLRNVLAFLDMPTLAQPEAFVQFKEGLFDAHGDITNEATKKFLQGWMDRYVAWVKTHTN